MSSQELRIRFKKRKKKQKKRKNEKTLTSEPVKKDPEKRIYEIVKRRLGPIDHGREKKCQIFQLILSMAKKTQQSECMEFYEPKRCGKRIR